MASPKAEASLTPPDNDMTATEDSGLRDIETSSEDEFSDAKEALASPTKPITRVEKVDTAPAHGEVPGTEAYDKRLEDAKPDQVAVQIKGSNAAREVSPPLIASHHESTPPVPLTVVTRVDSAPAHGEVPGTKAAELRAADAEPDILEKSEKVSSKQALNNAEINSPPSRPNSSIAADGGFGPMTVAEVGRGREASLENSPVEEDPMDFAAQANDFVDDFDDFAEGEDADDFGDFGDNFEAENSKSSIPPQPLPSLSELPFPALDFTSGPSSLHGLEQALSPHIRILFPSTEVTSLASKPQQLPEGNSAFLSDRSHSLWQQLVSPPPLQPPNWVRSRIRRLFLVSLGVPVDLDEILPKSKQKKLILPYDSTDSINKTALKLKEPKGSSNNKDDPPKRNRGPPPPPEFNMEEVERLCRKTGSDIEEMDDVELQKYVEKLEHLSEVGKAVLQYWIKRKEVAVDEKEAFDSVVESLVRHARRVRQ